jgi:hypothetical protein
MGGARVRRIIGPAAITQDEAVEKIRMGSYFATQNPIFLTEIVPALWTAGRLYSIDQVGMIAQSWKETGGGNFRGAVKPEMCNTCGLKIRTPGFVPGTAGDETLAHQIFPTWEVGAIAQAQHLRGYSGWAVPDHIPMQSGRYQYVIGKWRCETWTDLGGKWAPSLTYGQEIEAIMSQILA